jgi:hypothetical protein
MTLAVRFLSGRNPNYWNSQTALKDFVGDPVAANLESPKARELSFEPATGCWLLGEPVNVAHQSFSLGSVYLPQGLRGTTRDSNLGSSRALDRFAERFDSVVFPIENRIKYCR